MVKQKTINQVIRYDNTEAFLISSRKRFVCYCAEHCKHHQLENYWIHRTATIWQSVLIPCDFPTNVTVVWRYCRSESTTVVHITTSGFIANNLTDRFQLEPDGLLINDVQPSDAGWYICRQKHNSRTKQIILLSVPCKWHLRYTLE